MGLDYRSYTWNEPTKVYFKNESDQEIELFWYHYDGSMVSYGKIQPGNVLAMNTFATHPWRAIGSDDYTFSVDGECVYIPVASDNERTIPIRAFKAMEFNSLIKIKFENVSD